MAQPLCQFNNINYSIGARKLLDDCKVILYPNEIVGLIGRNGCGKSTLLSIMAKIKEPDTSTPPFRIDEPADGLRALLITQKPDLGSDVSVEEVIFEYYPNLKVLNDKIEKIHKALESSDDQSLLNQQRVLFEQAESEGLWEIRSSFESYLKMFSLNPKEKYVNLSGGEQRKVMISLGLSYKGDLVLWDEPTNHLDVESIQILEEELKNSNLSHIIISHDRYILTSLPKRIFSLTRGKIDSHVGSYEKFLESSQLSEEQRKGTLARLKNKLRREQDWMRQGIKARGTRSKKRVENFQQLKSNVAKIKSLELDNLKLSYSHSGSKRQILLEMKDTTIGYKDLDLIQNFSEKIQRGDKIGLIGENGSGKSSLLNTILKRVKPLSGELKEGHELKVAEFSQTRDELDTEMTPFQLLGQGSDFVILPGGRQKHVISYFSDFLFDKADIHRPCATFSGGEKARLQMALNLLLEADLYLIDEPTNDLDLETIEILEKALQDFSGAMVLISHDRAFLGNVTNKVWLIEDKKIEKFEAGYSQVEGYLEAKKAQKELEQLPTEEVAPTPVAEVPVKKKKLSNKEKIRLKELPKMIESAESKLATLDEEISGLTANAQSPEDFQKIADLQDQKNNLEEELLFNYEELEELQDE